MNDFFVHDLMPESPMLAKVFPVTGGQDAQRPIGHVMFLEQVQHLGKKPVCQQHLAAAQLSHARLVARILRLGSRSAFQSEKAPSRRCRVVQRFPNAAVKKVFLIGFTATSSIQ